MISPRATLTSTVPVRIAAKVWASSKFVIAGVPWQQTATKSLCASSARRPRGGSIRENPASSSPARSAGALCSPRALDWDEALRLTTPAGTASI